MDQQCDWPVRLFIDQPDYNAVTGAISLPCSQAGVLRRPDRGDGARLGLPPGDAGAMSLRARLLLLLGAVWLVFGGAVTLWAFQHASAELASGPGFAAGGIGGDGGAADDAMAARAAWGRLRGDGVRGRPAAVRWPGLRSQRTCWRRAGAGAGAGAGLALDGRAAGVWPARARWRPAWRTYAIGATGCASPRPAAWTSARPCTGRWPRTILLLGVVILLMGVIAVVRRRPGPGAPVAGASAYAAAGAKTALRPRGARDAFAGDGHQGAPAGAGTLAGDRRGRGHAKEPMRRAGHRAVERPDEHC